MADVTITLDNETARWAQDHAERLNVSVSRLVGDILRRLMETGKVASSASDDYDAVGREGCLHQGR